MISEEPSFPVNLWEASEMEIIHAITYETANMKFDGTPVLAIACFRTYPSASIICALISCQADPLIIYDGKTILDRVNNDPKVSQITKNEFAGWIPPAIDLDPVKQVRI